MQKKHFAVAIWAFLLLPSLFFAQPAADGWILKSKKDGIETYYRKTADIHELKLVTSLNVPLSGLVMLLSEVDNFPKWAYKVSESKLLKHVSDWENYYYSRIDFPWPLNDRDIIVHSVMEQDPITRRITSHSVALPEYLPENKGVIRLKNAKTSWTLLPGAGGWTYVEYRVYSDPGGNLPDWLVNMAIDVGPRETINGIRRFVLQDKYQSARLAHVKD